MGREKFVVEVDWPDDLEDHHRPHSEDIHAWIWYGTAAVGATPDRLVVTPTLTISEPTNGLEDVDRGWLSHLFDRARRRSQD